MTSSSRPCDPGPLDDLACQAKGVAEQAKYNAEQEPKLTAARTAFGAARAAYGAARHEAEKALVTGQDALARIFADKCRIDKAQANRLNRAFGRVKARLEACRPAPCCVDCECDWDDEVGRCEEPDDVAALIARIDWHIDRATRCFDDLLDETKPAPPAPTTPAPTTPAPGTTVAAVTTAAGTAAATAAAAPEPPASSPDGLAARVARVLAEIADIEAHADTWKGTRVYAAALVAQWHLQVVWNGFDDVNDYVDCLCRALTCMIKGHAAVARLKRRAAVVKCYRETWEKACAALDAQAVDEVLAEYLRICAAGDDGDDDDCDRDGDGDGDGYPGPDGDPGGDGGSGGGYGGEPAPDPGPPPRPPYEGRRPRPPETDQPSGPGDEPGYERPQTGPPSSPDEPRGGRPPYRDARGRYRAP